MTLWHAMYTSPWRERIDRLMGFGTHTLRFQRKEPRPVIGDGKTWVGAAEVDITPPPGIPKGGHSSMSTLGTGVRTRLKARAFYIRDGQGQAVMILQVDLHSGSALIREHVAQAIAGLSDVPQHAVCVTCTHTHSGPGQLHESNFYNDFASNKPGFDPALFGWLADQVTSAAVKAWQSRRTGRVLSGRREVWGAARIRSWEPWCANPGVNPALASGPGSEENRQRAVNPWMYMLRLDAQDSDGQFKPLAALTSYSVHGTAVSRSEGLYNADLWAWLERDVAHRIHDHYRTPWTPVHGACQGTHADTNPAISRGRPGFPEARRIGLLLAREAWELCRSLDGQTDSTPFTVAAGLRHVDCYKPPQGSIRLASRPAISTSQVAGAQENYTPVLFHLPLFSPGRNSARDQPGPDQGHKRVLGGPLQGAVFERHQFPHQLMFQVLRIGPFWLLASPFEITTDSGRRLRDDFRHVTGAGELVCVTSLANGYTGYCATPEEYALQHYEGGSTLYGANTLAFIGEQLRHIGVQLRQRNAFFEGPAEWQVELKARRYYPHPAPVGQRKALTRPRFVPARGHEEACWRFRWQDQDALSQQFERRLVSIEVMTQGGDWQTLEHQGHPVDDEGCDIAIELLGRRGRNAWVYEARWYTEADHAQHRFRIEARDHAPVLHSAPFVAD
jgi:neutral ceramidase